MADSVAAPLLHQRTRAFEVSNANGVHGVQIERHERVRIVLARCRCGEMMMHQVRTDSGHPNTAGICSRRWYLDPSP